MNVFTFKAVYLRAVMLILLGAVVVYWYLSSQSQRVENALTTRLAELESDLKVLAETTGLAQIDDATQLVVRDCSARTRYQELLQDLESLNQTQLREAKSLHAACGQYQPTVRAFMTHRLETAFAEYEDLVAITSTFDGISADDYRLPEWRSLIAKESARANLLREQGALQAQIIDVFVGDSSANLDDLVQEAQSINGSLNVTSLQINSEREALLGS